MEFSKNYRNVLYIILIIVLLLIFQAIQTYVYREYDPQYIVEDIVGSATGSLFSWIIIPLLIAIISKLIFKKQFRNILLKCMIFISIPLSLIGSYGAYYEYSKKNAISLPVKKDNNLESLSPSKIAKIQDIKKMLKKSMVSELISKKLDSLILEGDRRTRSSNPGVPNYVFEGMNQRLRSAMQAMIWEQNGLMDKFAQIYFKHMTHAQIKKLLKFYENPLWIKMKSGNPLSAD